MLKKAILGAVGLVVVGSLLWGTQFFGYLRTAKDEIQRAADDAVPIKFKVADAERMVNELDPEIKRVMILCAKQEDDVEKMKVDIAKKETSLGTAKDKMLALKKQFDKGEKEYVFDGRSYTQDEVRKDLAGKLDRFNLAKESLQKEKALLHAREEAWRINSGRLNEMMQTKKDLVAQVEFLKNRVETAEAAEALGKSEIVDSNSKMGRAQKLIADLNKKLDVDDKVRAAEDRLKGEIEVPETTETRDVSKELEDLFGDEAKPKTDL